MTTIGNHALAVNGADKLLTVDDLCEYLVVSKDFTYDEVRQGRLTASRPTPPPAATLIISIRAGRRGRTPVAAAAGVGWSRAVRR